MMGCPMPSPLGHVLAGLTVGLMGDPAPASRTPWWTDATTTVVLAAALAAALPDADLLVPVRHFHRTATHSLAATALILIITAAVTGKVTGRANWRLALLLATAHLTHLVMDWLGYDRNPPPGIQVLWPISRTYFISGLEWFPPTAREGLTFSMLRINAWAALYETLVVGPFVVVAWVRRRRGTRQA